MSYSGKDIADNNDEALDIDLEEESLMSEMEETITDIEDEADLTEDLHENDLIPEIKQQLLLLNQETNGLESEIQQLKNVYDELESLRSENEDLKQRLVAAEEQHNEFVSSFKEVMKKRDEALRYLLQEVKGLKVKMNELRSSLK